MTWHLVELDGVVKCGSECIPDEQLKFKDRALHEDEVDEMTHSRSMKSTVTCINKTDMHFHVICDAAEVDQAKVLLTRLVQYETAKWHKHCQTIAALIEY